MSVDADFELASETVRHMAADSKLTAEQIAAWVEGRVELPVEREDLRLRAAWTAMLEKPS